MLYEKGKMTINEAMKWPTDKARYDANYELAHKSKPISGFDDYLIIPSGKIYSKKTHKFLRNTKAGQGYLQVVLFKNRRRFHKTIHRLLLETFVGLCPKGMEACHNDGNFQNNKLENLRWDTRLNNIKDSINHGTHAGLRCGEKANASKLTEQEVKLIRKLYKSKELNQYQLAIKFNVSQSNISRIVSRKSRTRKCICGNKGYYVDNDIKTKCLLCEIEKIT